MARGWESKAVQDQIQEQQTDNNRRDKTQLTASQLEIRRRRQVLLLSCARVERELQSNPNPRYQEQLKQALADLDAQLSALSEK